MTDKHATLDRRVRTLELEMRDLRDRLSNLLFGHTPASALRAARARAAAGAKRKGAPARKAGRL